MTEKRLFEVEAIVRERRVYTLEAESVDGAQDVAQTDADALAGLHDVEGGSVRVTVEDVRIHEAKDVTEEYR